MARKMSIVGLVFGIINIVVALVPPSAGCIGAFYAFKQPPFPFKNVDLGPPLWRHVDKELPALKAEAVGSTACTGLLSLLLIGGAVGLFLNHDWGRWLSIGTAMLLILTLCIHDIYQLAVVRPSMMPVFAKNLPQGPPGEAEGAQIGFTLTFFLWSWLNSLFLLYLLAMSITLGLTRVLGKSPDDSKAPDDEPPRRRRRYDEDDDR